ncbi:MAG: methyltransferase domain-containing protein [Promethearchaeota archaeon]
MDARDVQYQLDLPYLPTPREVIDALLPWLATEVPNLPFPRHVDLGSGDGRVVITLARAFPDLTCTGYEINRELFESSVREARGLGVANCEFVRDDFFNADLSEVGLVTAFVLPTLARALGRLLDELPPRAVALLVRYDLPLDPLMFSATIDHLPSLPNGWSVYVHRRLP